MKNEIKILFLFCGLMIAGTAGYLLYKNLLAGYIFAHAGALGLIGIIACFTGIIARKKGLNFWKTLAVGLILPIILGIGFVLITYYTGEQGAPMVCGGAVSLAVAILTLISFTLVRKKTVAV